MDEMELIRQMISDTEELIRFFSSQKKPDRERATCAAFLRCLGIEFKVTDLVCVKADPPDICFDAANFEIKEYLDDDRRRHDEYKKLLEKLKASKKLSDLIELYRPPQSLSINEAAERVDNFIADYARSYGQKLCSTLDMLVYFNLNGYYLDDKDVSTDVSIMINQGWRSVSIISNSMAFVFFASESAPIFLRNAVGKVKCEWKGSGLFDLN